MVPLIIYVFAGIFPLIGICRLVRSLSRFAKNFKGNKSDVLQEWIKYLTNKAKKKDSECKVEELERITLLYVRFLSYLFSFIEFILAFPIFVIRIGIAACFGVKVLWWSCVSLYDLWFLYLVSLSFYLTVIGKTSWAIFLSSVMITYSISYILDYFTPDKKGILKIVSLPKHKVQISDILTSLLIIILGYGAIYYSITSVRCDAFSTKLSIFDAIYFSFVTISTVGYGDIIPTSILAKALVISEIIIGLAFLIIVLNIYTQIWFKKRTG